MKPVLLKSEAELWREEAGIDILAERVYNAITWFKSTHNPDELFIAREHLDEIIDKYKEKYGRPTGATP